MAAIAQVSNEDIRALGLTPAELLAAMARAVESLQRGDAGFIHKKAMHPRAGGEFYAMPATLGELAVVKWLNVAAKPAPGAPLIQAQLLATHIPSGRVLALMDAEWITARCQYVLEDDDPFPEGFMMADLWPMAEEGSPAQRIGLAQRRAD